MLTEICQLLSPDAKYKVLLLPETLLTDTQYLQQKGSSSNSGLSEIIRTEGSISFPPTRYISHSKDCT